MEALRGVASSMFEFLIVWAEPTTAVGDRTPTRGTAPMT